MCAQGGCFFFWVTKCFCLNKPPLKKGVNGGRLFLIRETNRYICCNSIKRCFVFLVKGVIPRGTLPASERRAQQQRRRHSAHHIDDPSPSNSSVQIYARAGAPPTALKYAYTSYGSGPDLRLVINLPPLTTGKGRVVLFLSKRFVKNKHHQDHTLYTPKNEHSN